MQLGRGGWKKVYLNILARVVMPKPPVNAKKANGDGRRDQPTNQPTNQKTDT